MVLDKVHLFNFEFELGGFKQFEVEFGTVRLVVPLLAVIEMANDRFAKVCVSPRWGFRLLVASA